MITTVHFPLLCQHQFFQNERWGRGVGREVISIQFNSKRDKNSKLIALKLTLTGCEAFVRQKSFDQRGCALFLIDGVIILTFCRPLSPPTLFDHCRCFCCTTSRFGANSIVGVHDRGQIAIVWHQFVVEWLLCALLLMLSTRLNPHRFSRTIVTARTASTVLKMSKTWTLIWQSQFVTYSPSHPIEFLYISTRRNHFVP